MDYKKSFLIPSLSALVEITGGQPLDRWKINRQSPPNKRLSFKALINLGPKGWYSASYTSIIQRCVFYIPGIYISRNIWNVHIKQNIDSSLDNHITKTAWTTIFITPYVSIFESIKTQQQINPKYNNLSLVCSTISGLSLFLITFFPFDKKLILHIIFASLIFICLAVWVISFMISRNKIDSEIEFRGQNLNEIRRKVVFFGVFSFIFMIVFVSLRMQSVGAIGEWCLMIAGQIQTLTFIPNLNNEK